jgi:hypothetical protein
MRFIWSVGLESMVYLVCRVGINGLYGVKGWNMRFFWSMRFIWCVGLEYAVYMG